jgi:ribosomal protein S18 acetylase RimI-like enzyme
MPFLARQVRAEYRRLAIGTALVSTLLAHARARGLRRVFLSTPAANERAVRFYTQRCGFAVERHYPLPLEYCFSPEHRMDLVELGIAL